MRVWKERRKGRGLYGARKVWLQLHREDIKVARCTVERLMREMSIAGLAAGRRNRGPRCPIQAPGGPVTCWNGTSPRQHRNRRWVADITYVPAACGFVYTAFVTDLFSRKIVGWGVADHLPGQPGTGRAGDGDCAPRDGITGDLVHHSDRGVQYTSIRYTRRHGGYRRGPLGRQQR